MGRIPENSPLKFTVEIMKIEPKKQAEVKEKPKPADVKESPKPQT